jgi:Fe-S-cluster containining protein
MKKRSERRRAEREQKKADTKHRTAEGLANTPLPKPSVHLPLLRLQQSRDWQTATRIAGTALTGGSTALSATKAVSRVGELMDRTISAALTRRPDCKRGCSFCCHVLVELSISELARALEFVGERFTPVQFDALKARAAISADGARGTTFLTYPVQPCAFLVDGECSIYEARPLACRAEHSFDVAACKKSYETSEDEPVERDMNVAARAHVMRAALESRLGEAGFAPHFYELQEALSIALNTPDAIEQWAGGNDVFAGAQTGDGLLSEFLLEAP